jgi:hypothetical protein
MFFPLLERRSGLRLAFLTTRGAVVMDPLHATIEEFAAEGYTHVECFARVAA